MTQPRIKSTWGRVILALMAFIGLTTLFAAIYVAATGVLNPMADLEPGSEAARAELERVLADPRFLVGMLLGQAVGGIVVVLVLALGVDRRPVRDLGMSAAGSGRNGSLGWGVLLGLVLASVVVLFITAAGGRHLKPVLFADTGWGWASVAIIAVTLAAFMEEWFIRGYLWANFRDTYSASRTIFLTTLIFAFLHSANPSASFLGWVNIYLIGLVLGQLREVTGGLRVPVGLHVGWNLTVGVVFGAQVSGIELPSLLRVSWVDLPVALGGGEFGPEASLAVTVLFGSIAVLLGRRMASFSAEEHR